MSVDITTDFRDLTIMPYPAAGSEDHSSAQGRFVVLAASGAAALCTSADQYPLGLIYGVATYGSETMTTVIYHGGLGGIVKIKLAASPGTVVEGTVLELESDGTCRAYDHSGSATVVAISLAAGTGGDLVDAYMFGPITRRVQVPAGVTEGDTLQWRSGTWTVVGRQSAVTLPASVLPADGAIAALPVSVTPTQAEMEAIRDELEAVRDEAAELRAALQSVINRLATTGGVGILEDA